MIIIFMVIHKDHAFANYLHSLLYFEYSHGQNVAPGATSSPQSYFCGPWPVTLGRVGPQKPVF